MPAKDNFADRLIQAIETKQSRVVVGLDPRLYLLPQHLRQEKIRLFGPTLQAVAEAILEFNRQIIDEVAAHAVAVKPQVAFYEQYSYMGMQAFVETVKYAQGKGMLVIADAKRNDIGTTAQAYADAYLGEASFWDDKTIPIFDVDAITINPFLGSDGIEPFIQVANANGKGLFILVRTSNPSARDIQDLPVNGEPLFEQVAKMVKEWGRNTEGSSGYCSVGAVVGATYPTEAEQLRKLMPKSFFLVPGYGAQGATAKDVKSCFNDDGLGAVVNSSRAITYAYLEDPEKRKYSPEEFALAAASATKRMREEIELILQ
jgi:orotidine-5'-phosphate decarboxylase